MTDSTLERWARVLGRLRERYAPYWFILPALVIIVAVLLYPLMYSFYVSLFDYRLARSARPFIGIENYTDAFGDRTFQVATVQNIAFAAVCVTLEFAFGLGLALLLDTDFKFQSLVRGLMLLPMLMAPTLAGFNWRWILNDRFGLLNQILVAVGMEPRGWLVTPTLARISIVMATIWQGIPFVMILLLSGLQALPTAPFEAAKVDGASPWQRFRYLTLPLLRPVIAVALALRVIDLFRIFDVIYILTFGGPGRATELLPFYIYRSAFSQSKMGYASAVSWLTLLITLVLLVPLFKSDWSK